MSAEPLRIPETRCLECRRKLDAIGTADPATEGATPNPGDPVACIGCGAVMTFENGRLRGFTEREMDALEADEDTMKALARIVQHIHFLRGANWGVN